MYTSFISSENAVGTKNTNSTGKISGNPINRSHGLALPHLVFVLSIIIPITMSLSPSKFCKSASLFPQMMHLPVHYPYNTESKMIMAKSRSDLRPHLQAHKEPFLKMLFHQFVFVYPYLSSFLKQS